MHSTFVYLPHTQRYINVLHLSRVEVYDEHDRLYLTEPNGDEGDDYPIMTLELDNETDRRVLRNALRLLTLNTQELPE